MSEQFSQEVVLFEGAKGRKASQGQQAAAGGRRRGLLSSPSGNRIQQANTGTRGSRVRFNQR